MLSCKITIASGLVKRVVISAFAEGGVSGGGEHHENQLNVFPFPPQKLIYYNSS